MGCLNLAPQLKEITIIPAFQWKPMQITSNLSTVFCKIPVSFFNMTHFLGTTDILMIGPNYGALSVSKIVRVRHTLYGVILLHLRSVINFMRSVRNFTRSVINFMRSVINFVRSVINFVRSVKNFMRSVQNFMRSVIP